VRARARALAQISSKEVASRFHEPRAYPRGSEYYRCVALPPSSLAGATCLGSGGGASHRRRKTDEQLVVRAQAGESWAEDALYRRHFRYVGGMVARLLRGSDEAEDILQETFALASID